LEQYFDINTASYQMVDADTALASESYASDHESSLTPLKHSRVTSAIMHKSHSDSPPAWPNSAYKAWVAPPEYFYRPLYTPEQRAIRDKSKWTLVQAILAPLQFLVFLISLGLVARYFATGQGYAIATASIVAKTIILYVIMITGSIWEKVVFGEWLFVESFFWEDVFSMLVLGLQTLYLGSLIFGWWTPDQQMMIAVAAYGTYVINAAQFIWKLRTARLEGAKSAGARQSQTGEVSA
jgi:3-vinyl bacteriochlorophyllide hydratase